MQPAYFSLKFRFRIRISISTTTRLKDAIAARLLRFCVRLALLELFSNAPSCGLWSYLFSAKHNARNELLRTPTPLQKLHGTEEQQRRKQNIKKNAPQPER